MDRKEAKRLVEKQLNVFSGRDRLSPADVECFVTLLSSGRLTGEELPGAMLRRLGMCDTEAVPSAPTLSEAMLGMAEMKLRARVDRLVEEVLGSADALPEAEKEKAVQLMQMGRHEDHMRVVVQRMGMMAASRERLHSKVYDRNVAFAAKVMAMNGLVEDDDTAHSLASLLTEKKISDKVAQEICEDLCLVQKYAQHPPM